MKQKTLIIEDYESSRQEQVKRLLVDMVKVQDVNLNVRLVYDKVQLTKEYVDNFADTVKAVGKEYEFLIHITIETHQWKNVKRLRKCLNQYAINIDLKVQDGIKIFEVKNYTKKLLLDNVILSCKNYEQFCERYHAWKTVGVSVRLEGYELSTKEYLEFFEMWIHDADAVWFVPFEDMANSMLTGVHVENCENDSCMGKYLYLDKEDNVYFCSKKHKSTKMYSLKQENPQFIYNEVYDKALQNAIEKRTKCQSSCEMFGFCRGACPLKERDQESCMAVIQKVACWGAFLEEEAKSAFAKIENPCMRQLYLSLIAYGFDFVAEE